MFEFMRASPSPARNRGPQEGLQRYHHSNFFMRKCKHSLKNSLLISKFLRENIPIPQTAFANFSKKR